MRRHPTSVPLACIGLALVCACHRDDDSSLQRRADARDATPTEPAAPAAATTPPAGAPAKPSTEAPPTDAKYVELRLALDPEVEYRVTTVGMIAFPMVASQTGFAREEHLVLSECLGEGFDRACTVQHRYGRFEAEPPAGKLVEADEARVRDLVTRHGITASGLRVGTTTVDGPEAAKRSEIGRQLANVHRFYCLRFPSEPVAVGAKWADECSFVHGGVVATQKVAWELSKLDEDPIAGTRAELTVVGELVAPGKSGERRGTVQGTLYFFVDRGQPHVLRLRTSLPLDAGGKVATTTTLNVQFARVRPDGALVRTDDQPFPETPPPAAGAPATGEPAPSSGAPP